MRWIRFAVLICLVTIVQAGFLSNFSLRPDLLTILLVFFAVYSSTTDAIITSFTIGFAADLIGPSMGSQMISFGIFGTSLAYLNRVIAMRNMPYQALAIFIITVLAGIMANILNSFKSVPPIEYGTILKTAIFSGIAGPFLFLPAAWWMRIKTQRNRRRF
jgi:rod shape-determining protein MreD